MSENEFGKHHPTPIANTMADPQIQKTLGPTRLKSGHFTNRELLCCDKYKSDPSSFLSFEKEQSRGYGSETSNANRFLILLGYGPIKLNIKVSLLG